MRLLTAAFAAVVSVVTVPHAWAQTSIDAFGSVRIDHVSSLVNPGFPVDFGGRVSLDVVPAVQMFGEFGQLGNVMPPLVDTGLAFSRLGLTVSAFYGEGGVRLVAAPHSAVTPYAEATAGVAHLRFGASGLGSAPDAFIRSALDLVDTRDPMFGAGGGIVLQGGAVRFDLGYRYKYIEANSALSSLVSAGQKMQSHQIRFGAGVRF